VSNKVTYLDSGVLINALQGVNEVEPYIRQFTEFGMYTANG
jgi:hypothetical protein